MLLDGKNIEFPVLLDALEAEQPRHCNDVYLLPIFGGRSGTARQRSKNSNEDEEKRGEDQKIQAAERYEASSSLDDELDMEDQLMIRGLVLRACGKDADNKDRFRRLGSFCFENFPTDWTYHESETERYYYHEFIRVLDEGLAKTFGAQGSDAGSNPRPCVQITIE